MENAEHRLEIKMQQAGLPLLGSEFLALLGLVAVIQVFPIFRGASLVKLREPR